MPAWALRVIAIAVTGLTMVGSTSYALAHPKNANAPLQPPIDATHEQLDEPEASAEPTSPPPFRTLAPTEPPTPSPSPKPTTPAPTARLTAAVAKPTTAPTATPRATATLRATPQLTLSAGVRATSLPKVTITHSS